MLPTLPTEVCERVLDHVDSLWKRKTLYNSCLVCHDWVPRSRLHLYNSVFLHPGNLTEFVHGVSLHPFNGHLVRDLHLRCMDARDGRDHHKLSLVPLLLPQLLPNLRHIRFFDMRLTDLHPKFFTYLSRFRSVRSITLTHMRYSTLIQVARYLTAFPGLNECELYLSMEDIENLSFPGDRLPVKRIAISNLILSLPTDLQIVDPILDIFSPSAIRSLRVSVHSRGFGGAAVWRLIASFITRCADTLSELSLDYKGWQYLDFSHNTHLVSLSLDLRLHSSRQTSTVAATGGLDHPSTIARILSTISSKHLKELHLQFYTSLSSNDTISPSGWDELDAALALPIFSQVERISTNIRVDNQSEYVSEKTVRTLLPRLAFRSVADFLLSGSALREARDFEISSPDEQDVVELET